MKLVQINEEILNVISLGGENNKKLVSALKNRNKISFRYIGPRKPDKESVKPGNRLMVEPVAIGLTKKGYMAIKGWVSNTSSVTKTGFEKHQWRTFLVSRIHGLKITDEIFDEKPPGYKEGDDPSFSKTYYTVDWGEKKEPQTAKTTEPKPEPVEPQVAPQTEPKTAEPVAQTVQTLEPQNIEPEVEPQQTEPENLPQPEPEEKPTVEPEVNLNEPETDNNEPEEEEENNLQENINRIKRLMLL